ncbi:MAG: 4-hydroxybenzoate octaprenyltransferase [Paracoccaceae bacterium]|nr:4-hydroxybenzoate octaprenyltransferase [Paracoccaceae bacterium]
MNNESKAPEGQVADAVKMNWVDHWAPAWSRPYLRLSRADRPIGTWLLLLPCWWGVLLAALADPNGAKPLDLWIILACAMGAFLMRGAGCTWNDITDRHYDAEVERTRSRPIPSGQVNLRQAVLWMALQALISLSILLTLAPFAIFLGFLAILPVAVYPYAKRFTWWPQVFLGLAFNWGALLAWSAHHGSLSWAPVVLYIAGISWTLFYDTIYAHQDTEDDALIGVKSTARLFGENSPKWLNLFLTTTVILLGFAILLATQNASLPTTLIALIAPWAMGWHMMSLMKRLDISDPESCLSIFRAGRNTGLIVTLFLAVSLLV